MIRTCYNCKQPGHLDSKKLDCKKSKRITYFKCEKEGHINLSCPGGNKVSGATNLIDRVSEKDGESSVQTFHINKVNFTEVNNACVMVRSVRDCELRTLIDTGSPVSLIRDFTFKSFPNKELFKVSNSIGLKGVNDSSIKIRGKIYEQIAVEEIPNR